MFYSKHCQHCIDQKYLVLCLRDREAVLMQYDTTSAQKPGSHEYALYKKIP